MNRARVSWWPARCATLAGRSAQAAREIKSLISDSVSRVDAGGQLVQQAATPSRTSTQVQKVSELILGISQASAEQTQGITQVSAAVDQLDQVTQQNAALVEESSAAADSLDQHARQLVAAVGVFQLGADAATAGAALSRRTAGFGYFGLQRLCSKRLKL